MPDTGRELPKDKSKSFVVNGIRFKNRKEYDERLKEDTEKLAQLLLDIYNERKNKPAS